MNRFCRLVLLFVAVAFAVWSRAEAATVAHVGFLRATAPDALFESFRDGMRKLGYVEGRNLVIEQRWANHDYSVLPRLAQELVDLKVDVIFATCTLCTQAAVQATHTIPIVTISGDPVSMGFAASLARPGGNVTGVTLVFDDLAAKSLELLKQLAPTVSAIAVLWPKENPLWERAGIMKRMAEAAVVLGLQFEAVPVAGSRPIEHALRPLIHRRNYALYVFDDALFRGQSTQIVAFAAKHRVPAVYGAAVFVQSGGLMSYAPNYDDLYRKCAGYVAQILMGADAGQLPVQQPTKFDLAVNLKTAKELSITVPESMLVLATEVIR